MPKLIDPLSEYEQGEADELIHRALASRKDRQPAPSEPWAVTPPDWAENLPRTPTNPQVYRK